MNKEKKLKILTISILVGMILIFLFPIFPLPLNNKVGAFSGFMWISGLMQLTLSLKSFILLELLGGSFGLLVSFIYVESQNNKE